MSILAGPRRKQRISVDPQNIAWKNDNGKFGKKLMEKMGWQEGRGLGVKEQGMCDNLKLKANHTAKGLGCEYDYDSTWITHHDEFASLLANLNKNKSTSKENGGSDGEKKTKSLEESSKTSKARIHYPKFTRGKDLSRFSSKDKSAVIGVGVNRKRKHSPEPVIEEGEEPTKEAKKEKKDEKRDVEADTGFGNKTQVSQISVADYFAEKMRKMKERAAAKAVEKKEEVQEEEPKREDTEEAKEETEEERKLRKQRRKEEKRRLKEEARIQAEAEAAQAEAAEDEENVVEETKEERKRRKREKKLRKLAESQENEA
ncbi:hypothetical protein QR680_009156 [Steinernema hermaphroditum]|uniref:G-patch domain-containing protein n=1 Tax=Steinernema hermaphroditum TaxID=289476 RepID=A0AA39IL28_9BILA|nr:hypothetical protein QR680_009156 [Steinernema hermaphroditum]